MHTDILGVICAMLLLAEAPKLLFPSETNQPTSHKLMTRGDFWACFTLWSCRCGWYLLVLVGFGAYYPGQRRIGAAYLDMQFLMWLGWASLVYWEKRPSTKPTFLVNIRVNVMQRNEILCNANDRVNAGSTQ